jgi:hypothetical protein
MEIEYKIMNFNYLLVSMLFLAGVGLYVLLTRIIKRRAIKVTIAIIATLTVLALIIFKPDWLVNEIKTVINYIKIISTAFYNSTETEFYYFETIVSIIIPLFTIVFLYLESKGLGNILVVISIIYISYIWYVAELFEIRNYIIVYMIMCSTEFCISKLVRVSENHKLEGIKVSIDNRKLINYFIILSTIVSVLSFSAVSKFGSKSLFTYVNEKLATSKKLLQKSKNNRYDISQSGYFSSSTKLGGPIKLSKERVFKVESDDIYYLKGIVKDFYDGFSWNRTDNNYKKQESEPLRSMTLGFSKYLLGIFHRDIDKSIDKIDSKSMVIYPDELYNSSIFAPSFAYSIKLQHGYIGYDDTESYMILGRTGIQSPYTVYFYKSKSGVENFKTAYEKKINLSYETAPSNSAFISKYSKYLQIPDNISQEIYDLVKEITEDCVTATEKAIKIQQYLSDNYTYTLEVSEVPENKEFIEHFLFAEKKGYCTYFATAATIMYRIAGIPSRYVEGFAMSDIKNQEGLYEVTHEMAHAWTEILLSEEDDIWSIVDCVPYAEREQYIRNYVSYEDSKKLDSSTEGEETQDNSSISKNGVFYEFREKTIAFSRWMISAAFVIVLVFVSIRLTIAEIKKHRILKSNSAIPMYYYTKGRIKHLYAGKRLDDDDLVWLEGIENNYVRNVLQTLINSVYEEFYGKKADTKVDKELVYKSLESYLKLKQGVFYYFFYKILY